MLIFFVCCVFPLLIFSLVVNIEVAGNSRQNSTKSYACTCYTTLTRLLLFFQHHDEAQLMLL